MAAIPIVSMYGIFDDIWPLNNPNVGKYGIYGDYGIAGGTHCSILDGSETLDGPLSFTGDAADVGESSEGLSGSGEVAVVSHRFPIKLAIAGKGVPNR